MQCGLGDHQGGRQGGGTEVAWKGGYHGADEDLKC